MILKDWLKKKGIKPYRFAKTVGISPAALYKNLAGTHRICARFAVKIEASTKGEVSRTEAMWPESFMDKEKCGAHQMRLFNKVENHV